MTRKKCSILNRIIRCITSFNFFDYDFRVHFEKMGLKGSSEVELSGHKNESMLSHYFWVMNMLVFKPSFKQLIDCINWSARIGLNCLGRVSLSHKPTRCDKTLWDIVSSVSEQRNGLYPCPWCISWPGNNSGGGVDSDFFQEKVFFQRVQSKVNGLKGLN